MIRLSVFVLFAIALVNNGFAVAQLDSTVRAAYVTLADKMRLRPPKLKEGDYEVRIWNRQSLVYGTAQTLYVLKKKEKAITASMYIIRSDESGFKYTVRLRPTLILTPELWSRLLQYDMLTLPDQAAIQTQLHPPYRPRKDSSWISVETDGSVSVHAKRITDNLLVVSDGEGYHVEVFEANEYRGYGYSNPRIYSKHRPDIVELKKMVAILDEIAALFR